MTKAAFDSFYIKGKTILCGDFNAKHLELGNKPEKVNGLAKINGIALIDIISTSDLFLLSKGVPTHTSVHGTSDQLDLFFCSDKLTSKVSDVEVLPDLTGSDHLPILICTDFNAPMKCYPNLRLNLRKAKWDKYFSLVDDKCQEVDKFLQTHDMPIFDEIDFITSGLTDAIVHGKCGAIPTCPAYKIRPTPQDPVLIAAIKNRRRLRNIWQRTGDRHDKSNWNRASRIVKNLSHLCNNNEFSNECTFYEYSVFQKL